MKPAMTICNKNTGDQIIEMLFDLKFGDLQNWLKPRGVHQEMLNSLLMPHRWSNLKLFYDHCAEGNCRETSE